MNKQRIAYIVNWQRKQNARGRCRCCPKPLAIGNVQYCEEHREWFNEWRRNRRAQLRRGARRYGKAETQGKA